jgi:hypothetical protein
MHMPSVMMMMKMMMRSTVSGPPAEQCITAAGICEKKEFGRFWVCVVMLYVSQQHAVAACATVADGPFNVTWFQLLCKALGRCCY